MSDASFAASFSSLMTFFLDGIDSYSSVKSSSTATPSLLFGKSRMCPIDATTLKSRPRYLLMVLAFAGDSTTTSAFAMGPIRDWWLVAGHLLFTLTCSVKPDEPSAAGAPDHPLHFQLEKPRQHARWRKAGPLGDDVELALLAGRKRRQHRVGARRLTVAERRGHRWQTKLFQDIVRGLHNLCTIP